MVMNSSDLTARLAESRAETGSLPERPGKRTLTPSMSILVCSRTGLYNVMSFTPFPQEPIECWQRRTRIVRGRHGGRPPSTRARDRMRHLRLAVVHLA